MPLGSVRSITESAIVLRAGGSGGCWVFERGVTRELEKAKNNLAAHLLRELATNNGRAHALGTYELMLGDWRQGLALPTQYETITSEQVRLAAAKYLSPEKRSVVTLVPIPETGSEVVA